MRILFVHQNFPGQYAHVAPALSRLGHDVRALMLSESSSTVAGVACTKYKVRRGSSDNIHPWVADFETKIVRGEGCAYAALALRKQGFTPDLICVHPGWGEALYLRDVWPQARQLHFVEWYYHWHGQDMNFDPEFNIAHTEETKLAGQCRLRSKNTHLLQSLMDMDYGFTPTYWQRAGVPECFHQKINVIHDGIDTDLITTNPTAVFEWHSQDGSRHLRLTAQDQVVSFINRNFEPSRGYHIFMRSLPALLDKFPKAQVVLVGGDGVSYGAKHPSGTPWQEVFWQEIQNQLSPSMQQRVHFVGCIAHTQLIQLYQVTQAHVYLTYPFVLSWSALEAMSAGAVLIGSATPPVQEVIQHGDNGLLVDFFDIQGLINTVSRVLTMSQAERQVISKKARQTILARYDLKRVCLPQQIELIYQVAELGFSNH